MLDDPRVLVSGSRRWPGDAAVDQALDRLLDRYHERLTVVEGRARGADLAAHRWCVRHRLGPDRHRCYPVDWAAERRRRPTTWRQAGHDRNTRMLLREWPELAGLVTEATWEPCPRVQSSAQGVSCLLVSTPLAMVSSRVRPVCLDRADVQENAASMWWTLVLVGLVAAAIASTWLFFVLKEQTGQPGTEAPFLAVAGALGSRGAKRGRKGYSRSLRCVMLGRRRKEDP